MKKELLISTKFDTSDFDKSVESMQKKLKELYSPGDQIRAQAATASRLQQNGMPGLMTGPSSDAFNRSQQQGRRELDQHIAQQAREQEKLTKVYAARVGIIKELKEAQKMAVKDSKEELEIKQKIARVEENSQKMREMYKQRDQTLNQMITARETLKPQGVDRLMNAYRNGGIGGAMTAGGRMAGQGFAGNPLAFGGSVVGGIGTALGIGSDLYRDFKGMPIRTEAAQGNAIQGTLGRDVGNIYGRRSAFEQNFQPERQRAAQQAIEMMHANRAADKGGLAGNLLSIGGGAAVGMGTAGLGALGGAAMVGKGLYGLATNERQRSLALSPFSKTSNARYESQIAEQMGRDYTTSYEAQKQQNPFKTAAVGEYEQNFQRNLGAQRGMGVGNEQFYGPGGFLSGNIKAGFTGEQGIEMGQGILGAGGSSRSAFGNSVLGNQMGRGMNLTNSANILGAISGGTGSAESTKAATIKILAEGMKLGLDDSKFAEENRRFTQAAAEVIGRSGAKGEEDFGRLAETFGKFQVEKTNLGVEAGKSAYERYQQISGEQTGPRGVMRAASVMRDKDLSKLGTVDRQALLSMPENQLTEENMVVQRAAEVAGISPAEVIQKMRGANQNAVSRFGEADKIRDKLKTENDPKKIRSLQLQLASFNQAEQQFGTSRELESFTMGTAGGIPQQFGPGAGEGAVGAKLEGRQTGRMEDNTIAAMAADAGTVLKNFNAMRGGMDQAAKSAAAFTDEIRELGAELQQALENVRSGKGSASDIQRILNKQVGAGSSNQTQSGKTSK